MVQAYRADTENAGAGPQPVSRFRAMRRKLTSDPGIWRRGILLALCSVLLTVVLVLHSDIPNTIGNTGSLIETFLPWFGVFVPVLLILGLLRRSATAVIALVLPVAVWLNLFGGLLFADKSGAGGDLTVATHNVNAGNPDPAGTAQQVAGSGADILALQELPSGKVEAYEDALADRYPHHSVQGTVGLWSKYPVTDSSPVDIKLGWTRAMSATVTTPRGPVKVYVAHLLRAGQVERGLHRQPAGRQRRRPGRGDRRRTRGAGRPARRPERHDERPLAERGHRPDALHPGRGGRRVRLQLARVLPDGADRPDHGARRRAPRLLDPPRHGQRPPPDRGPRAMVSASARC